MKLHRFYIDQTVGNTHQIRIASREIFKRVVDVVCLNPGDSFVIYDNSGYDYEIVIIGYDNFTILGNVVARVKNEIKAVRNIYLFSSIIKKDNFEWIVQKATEMGVMHIIPVLSQRSEKKNLIIERLQKIAVEASEQSGRGTIPEIHRIMKLDEAVEFIKDKKEILSIAFHTGGQKFKKEEVSENESIAVFIGPEGGWTDEEIAMFHKEKIAVRTLGPQILRAETAVVAVLAQVVF